MAVTWITRSPGGHLEPAHPHQRVRPVRSRRRGTVAAPSARWRALSQPSDAVRRAFSLRAISLVRLIAPSGQSFRAPRPRCWTSPRCGPSSADRTKRYDVVSSIVMNIRKVGVVMPADCGSTSGPPRSWWAATSRSRRHRVPHRSGGPSCGGGRALDAAVLGEDGENAAAPSPVTAPASTCTMGIAVRRRPGRQPHAVLIRRWAI